MVKGEYGLMTREANYNEPFFYHEKENPSLQKIASCILALEGKVFASFPVIVKHHMEDKRTSVQFAVISGKPSLLYTF